MQVLKFGGTSVGSADNIQKVKEIVSSIQGQKVVVVSAVGGITDRLISMARTAEQGDKTCFENLQSIIDNHFEIIDHLFQPIEKDEVIKLIEPDIEELKIIIKGVFLIRELSRKSFESLSGMGERLSSKIIARYIGAKWFDSRNYIKTNFEFGRNQVITDETNKLLSEVKPEMGNCSLFPGFISSNKKSENTTLGRGGSDYTAALLAAAFKADNLQIWTDVDGFMTADPRVISRAYCIDKLSYAEAMELSHFGAKVIYPPTIIPAFQSNIPIWIKNTFNPMAQGTLINNEKVDIKERQIKGISSIKEVSLLTLQGIGMVGVTGISMRLFTALAANDVNIILISQASSENSISVVIGADQSSIARNAIEHEFRREIAQNHISPVTIDENMAVVAIVGENMKHTTGIAGQLFNSVGKNGVNIYAIAQGASELNISFVIKEKDIRKALNVIHEAFFLSDYSRLNLFLAGKGTVGSKLLNKVVSQARKLKDENNLMIRLVGVAGSSNMLLEREGLNAATVIEDLDNVGEPCTIESFRDRIIEMNVANSVFVDCTASEQVASVYQSLLDANVSVVTANKIASSSSYAAYSKLKATAREKGVKFFFETNVGAGLPVIAPINDLVKSGDKIERLEAVLSGTLNFIVNTLSEDNPLSDVISEAKAKGFSEPDPRVDLSGTDVVRKLLILARESGYVLEQEDVEVEPFVPAEYLDLPSLDAFMDKVKDLNPVFENQRKNLAIEGKRLRYAARLSEGKAKVGLIEVDSKHPFYDLEGSNNIILVWSENYNEHPLQVKGYGAGADVTAAGVFADIIKVANV
ncbi:bifunctional aspartate kinase/homoserine dehydrogenase I [Alkalitalea saponilacus]|uniref:Aspartate kinase n=1 Tax=Alkalitalea saponilacus TaxID=889453 RepID=A0A1T5EWH8_9BACT|nr:bifunctional aspartate kinase/homoserine dehydrogenase I [Alkalitalea saponilacus]ASB47993.1 bifunctional aspartate kinase/homoserine dehydrogenase I [Alkalitalea saponilacus]SKB88256.1 aspartate kinase [Alkalitalea saponilacus]